jgi:hypothetical protein
MLQNQVREQPPALGLPSASPLTRSGAVRDSVPLAIIPKSSRSDSASPSPGAGDGTSTRVAIHAPYGSEAPSCLASHLAYSSRAFAAGSASESANSYSSARRVVSVHPVKHQVGADDVSGNRRRQFRIRFEGYGRAEKGGVKIEQQH